MSYEVNDSNLELGSWPSLDLTLSLLIRITQYLCLYYPVLAGLISPVFVLLVYSAASDMALEMVM